jgi:HD-GYP domain-containing protein (c-di-GMP phosphodiesterase class II)
MKALSTSALLPETFYDAPVFLDDGFILVAPDIRVNADLIARLAKWRYTTVLTDGSPVDRQSYLTQAAGSAKIATLEEDIKERQRIEESAALHAEFSHFTDDFYRSFQDRNILNTDRLTDMLKKAIGMVRDNRNVILRFGEFESVSDNQLVSYSVDTSLLAIALGEYLKLPAHKLLELAVAAFLHDLGMTKVPSSIVSSGKPLTADEKKAMMYHTVIGYKLLRAYSLSEDVALGALEHHERIDGSGYPRRFGAAKLSLYGKIIAVACSYVASTSRRKYKAARDGNAAIRDLLTSKQYDPACLKALICTLSFFPLGSYVLLSNQAQGIVVDANPATPRLPVVKMLIDPAGVRVTKSAAVQTAEDGGISVLRSLTRQETERLRTKLAS